ncbi:MAG TPA: hypothetical protein VMS21_07095 [Methylomirabilota bacterium]|nr:hypothetical protein [Methylomirabilota bacterium]
MKIALAMTGALVVWGHVTARAATEVEPLRLSWTNNMLRVSGEQVTGGSFEVWYLEAFCRSGSTHRRWEETVIPHRTELLEATPRELRLKTLVEPSVEILHHVRATVDEVVFELELVNRGERFVDVQWFQPCIRVDRFTGRTQADYHERCFIFTESGRKRLDETERREEAIYRGGQVYVPEAVDLADVNPRPISPERPVNGLIGCVSADGKQLLATAWSDTQELFQGVIVCIHNDPRVGGLAPGETKRLTGRLYVLANDTDLLLRRYREDFGEEPAK